MRVKITVIVVFLSKAQENPWGQGFNGLITMACVKEDNKLRVWPISWQWYAVFFIIMYGMAEMCNYELHVWANLYRFISPEKQDNDLT